MAPRTEPSDPPPQSPEKLGQQLRRRYRASLRLPPLPDGRRDPMSRSRSDAPERAG